MPVRHRYAGLLFAAILLAAVPSTAAEPDAGFSTLIRPLLTGEEIGSQQDLWTLEVSIKPMRTVFVQVSDPKTGAKSSEVVWYLVYKIVNRAVPKRVDAGELAAVNVEDPAPPSLFVPKATLVAENPDLRSVVVDSIVPEALQAITVREHLDLKTSVQIAGLLPKLTAADAKVPNAEYGVFMFRNVNPRTTIFSIYLSGFSSAYKLGKDAAGKPIVLRRTIRIPYRRNADEFDQFEKEIRQSGDAKWIYVPEDVPPAK